MAGKLLVGTMLAGIGALAAPAPALAQPTEPPGTTAGEANAQAVYHAMLVSLRERRANVARSTASAQSRRAALAFLDRQIASVKSRLQD